MKAIVFKRNLVIALTFLFVGAFGIPTNGLADLNDGLVGHWTFDEGSGGDLHDYSGNENHGIIYGGPQWVNGVSGSALEFDGVDDYVLIPNSASLSITDFPICISVWLKKYPKTGIYKSACIVFKGDRSGDRIRSIFTNYYLRIDMPETIQSGYGDGSASNNFWTYDALGNEVWTHIVVNINGKDDIDMFWNTLPKDGHTWGSAITPTGDYDLYLSVNPPSLIPDVLKGVLDEVRIYDRALSEEEIEELYEMHAPEPPTAFIDDISPNPAELGQEVTFVGHGEDTDGSVVAYEWTSSIDGWLSDQASFSTSDLSEGTHTIYFKVRDDDGTWSAEDEEILDIMGRACYPYGERYGIIVMGGNEPSSVQLYRWYWGDTKGMYHELISYGFTGDNIYFLSYGDSANVHPEWVDAISTTANIRTAYQWAQTQCTANDLLYIYWVDHGTSTHFNTNDGVITHAELGTLMQPIVAKITIGAYNPCFSGAVIDDISRPGVITVTSQDDSHVNSWGWAGMWRRALRGDPADGIDTNGDGYISMTEAYNWIAPLSQAAGEHSMFDDNGDGVGHEWGQPGYNPDDPAQDGYKGKFYSLDTWCFLFILGDTNGDGLIDLGDVLHLINFLYKGGPAPHPLCAGDVNCDGIVDLGDVLYLISYLYKGGPAPGC